MDIKNIEKIQRKRLRNREDKRLLCIILCTLCSTAIVLFSERYIYADRSEANHRMLQSSSRAIIIPSTDEITTSNLLPSNLAEEIKAKDYRILALGHNLAAPVSAADYLSNKVSKISVNIPRAIADCAHDMLSDVVGEDPVDFIFLEYYYCVDGLIQLSYILRERYPEAVIVLLDIWHPSYVQYTTSNNEIVDLQQWSMNRGYPRKRVDMFDLFLQSSEPWAEENFPHKQQCLDELQNGVGAYAFKKEKDFDSRPTSVDEYKKTVVERLYLYQNDWNGLSGKGHEDVARGLLGFVKYLNHEKSDVLGPWPVDIPSCTA